MVTLPSAALWVGHVLWDPEQMSNAISRASHPIPQEHSVLVEESVGPLAGRGVRRNNSFRPGWAGAIVWGVARGVR